MFGGGHTGEAVFAHATPSAWSYLRESEWNPGSGLPAGIAGHTRFESCIECPVREGFTGPAALAFLNRELAKEPEKKGKFLPPSRTHR